MKEMYPEGSLSYNDGKVIAIRTITTISPQHASAQFDELTRKGFSLDLTTGVYHLSECKPNVLV